MNQTEKYRTNIIRFNGNYTTQNKLFQWGQEWEFVDKYKGMVDFSETKKPNLMPGWIYRILFEDVYYHIPETYVVEGYTNNAANVNQFNTTNTWDKKVTQDAIQAYDESGDFVGAAKEYLGRNIGAKKRQDQSDYASTTWQKV